MLSAICPILCLTFAQHRWQESPEDPTNLIFSYAAAFQFLVDYFWKGNPKLYKSSKSIRKNAENIYVV